MLRVIAVRTAGVMVPALSGRSFAVTFAVLLITVATPIFTDPLPPLSDYVNHLARMHIIASLDHDAVLGQLYEINWAIIPNLIMDVLVPPLARHVDVYLAGQIFVFLTMVLMATGPMAIHRALYGRYSPWPLISFAFVYNGVLLLGLMNYLMGLGFALWGIAAWIALRRRSPVLRGAVSTVTVVVLFICHLYAVGLYGLGLLAFEAARLAEGHPRSLRILLIDALAFGLPFLPVLPLIAASPTLALSTAIAWEPQGKLDGLYLTVQLYRDVVDLLFLAVLISAAVWLARRNALRLHATGWNVLVLGAAAFMAMPRVLFGSWLADQRLPIAILFMMIGFIGPELKGRAVRAAFYAFLVGLTAARFVEVQANWQELDRVRAEFGTAIATIPIGSSILVAHADHPSGTEVINQTLAHAPCIAVIERDALVSTIFSVAGKQVLGIRPSVRDRVDAEDGDPPRVSQLVSSTDGPSAGDSRYWDGWPTRYDYVFILYTERGDDNPDPQHLAARYEGENFQLYQTQRRPSHDR